MFLYHAENSKSSNWRMLAAQFAPTQTLQDNLPDKTGGILWQSDSVSR